MRHTFRTTINANFLFYSTLIPIDFFLIHKIISYCVVICFFFIAYVYRFFFGNWLKLVAGMTDFLFTCMQFGESLISCSFCSRCSARNWSRVVAGMTDLLFNYLKFNWSWIPCCTSELPNVSPVTYTESVTPCLEDIWNLMFCIGSLILFSWMDSPDWNNLFLVCRIKSSEFFLLSLLVHALS